MDWIMAWARAWERAWDAWGRAPAHWPRDMASGFSEPSEPWDAPADDERAR